jgi:hypothetical protein
VAQNVAAAPGRAPAMSASFVQHLRSRSVGHDSSAVQNEHARAGTSTTSSKSCVAMIRVCSNDRSRLISLRLRARVEVCRRLVHPRMSGSRASTRRDRPTPASRPPNESRGRADAPAHAPSPRAPARQPPGARPGLR